MTMSVAPTLPTDMLVVAAIETEIANEMRKYHRMPEHWEARRLETMGHIEKLIDQWLALKHGCPR